MSDMQEVVRSCQQGQLDDFTAFFKLYQSHVFDLASVILRYEAAAEGAV
jgi:hypothetical protein